MNMSHQIDQNISQLLQQNNHQRLNIFESKIATEIEKNIRIGLESAFRNQNLALESKIASKIEKQTQTIYTKTNVSFRKSTRNKDITINRKFFYI